MIGVFVSESCPEQKPLIIEITMVACTDRKNKVCY